MLDLWFGLDASGFQNACMVSIPSTLHSLLILRSGLPSNVWPLANDHVCLLEQHFASYQSVITLVFGVASLFANIDFP